MDELTSHDPATASPNRVTAVKDELVRVPRAVVQAQPAEQAHWILRTGFVAAPLLAGADKFFNRMCRWEKYLAPQIKTALPVEPRTFMYGVGIIEMAAGILVARRPTVGAYVVAGWLGGIIGNLLLSRRYYDIALRDLGLALGALALGRLASDGKSAREVRMPRGEV